MFTTDSWKVKFWDQIQSTFPEICWATIDEKNDPIDITLIITVESSIEVVDHLKIFCCVDRKRINDDNVVFEKLFGEFCKVYSKYLSDHRVDRSKLSLED